MRQLPSRSAALLWLTSLLLACSAREPHREPGSTARISSAGEEQALVAFDLVADVLQHPRCMNCHPAGDRPLQFDAGRPHAMNVVRGDNDRGMYGMRCASCHGSKNSDTRHLPPGVAADWRLAPRSMAFEGLSRSELAAMLLDEERSHLSPEELLQHVEHDPLVLWGWEPGPGREPVPVAHSEFVTALRTWIDAGAPAPAETR